ncbi:hypothetical protein EV401DRAFT_1849355 [Pisolithus croceorrhizus]|nr:hypothetical protein EV401DRAFT_1849355 [Pisolithus croceorrhizus]
MATSASSRATPPSSRRSSHSVSPPSAAVLRNASSARAALATARSTAAVNSGASRHPSVKSPSGSLGSIHESRDVLSTSLKQETEKKEQLMVQLQNKDHAIASLASENDSLMSSLNAAESRLGDLYADQARMEEELAARIEVIDKLRSQTRDLEKEKRDLQRRYNEQMSTFDAERQAFYDNEQHLKSRIQSLTQARKQSEPSRTVDAELEVAAEETVSPSDLSEVISARRQDMNDPECEPAEMTALRLELSTLSTSYSSLQSTLQLLQSQLVDLKRVNNQLQEENESYMILLRERTLSGQFDLMRQVGGTLSTTSGFEDGDLTSEDDAGSLRSTGRSALDVVEEMEEGEDLAHLDFNTDRQMADSRRRHPRHTRKNGSMSHSPGRVPRGESLADLPVAGPGLDLAAELGRAENKDIELGTSIDERTGLGKGRRGKASTEPRHVSSSEGQDPVTTSSDIDALRMEVKSLKDANKALSLYASKIIDRIIAEEGFERVLAIDYERGQKTPSTATLPPNVPPILNAAPPVAKGSSRRPQSVIFGHTTSNSVVASLQEPTPTPALSSNVDASTPTPSKTTKAQRRSLSFDWRGFSMFGGEKRTENPALRPLTLKPGTTPVTSARKLETYEDEEDRRERERLRATMKLLGIEKPDSVPDGVSSSVGGDVPTATPIQKSYSSPSSPPATVAPFGRFSIFRSRSTGASDSPSNSLATSRSASMHTPDAPIDGRTELTREALEQAEAEDTLAVLDAHERNLSEEIAKGGTGGFTEISPKNLGEEWRSRRSKMSGGGGSGSTVWSAGMSRAGDDPEP